VNCLDDLNEIKKIDSADFIKMITGFPQQLPEALTLSEKITLDSVRGFTPSSVVFTGLGGSAIGAELARSWLNFSCSKPVIVNRHYRLPAFVSEKTLVIAISYSGNTDATLMAVDEALRRKAPLCIISSGGELKELALNKNIPFLEMPKGYFPRMAIGFSSVCILSILNKLGLCPSAVDEVQESSELLTELEREKYGPNVPYEGNFAKQLAQTLFGKYPLIYSSVDYLEAIAFRWRQQLEENAKTLTGHFLLPEMAHNEIQYLPKALLCAYPEFQRVNFSAFLTQEYKLQTFSLQKDTSQWYFHPD